MFCEHRPRMSSNRISVKMSVAMGHISKLSITQMNVILSVTVLR